MKHWLRFILSFIVLGTLISVLNHRIGSIPPLGKFLSPFTGFWQNNTRDNGGEEKLRVSGLKETVVVRMDDNLVPHVFAKSDYDLYFTQGYLHAKYRLWQMEFQTHAAAGRISEIVGAAALEFDLFQRRFGMVYAAENAVKAMEQDARCLETVRAYTDGVNAWILQLSDRDLPVEYKLLNYRPEAWTPLKCALLLKYMTYDLATNTQDIYLSEIRKRYGQETVDSLFSESRLFNDPIIPLGTAWDFTPEEVPPVPEEIAALLDVAPAYRQPDPDNGSNNWAVDGSRTISGLPILCGDPHLALNLPSLWYQMQLAAPGLNVYGVSLPGTPCIIIGFNEHIAWSETNVDADVLDWYRIVFRDSSQLEYEYDGAWRKTMQRVEVIRIRNGKEVMDTVTYTHHGPVIATGKKKPFRDYVPGGYAMRWLGHDPSLELKSFLLFNRAQSYDEFIAALQYFSCPAQNFVYADAGNNVALWVNGKYPLKYTNQGKFLLRGNQPEDEWNGWIPHAHNPHVVNPPRGFVSSANQWPADTSYPYYLNWQFELGTRGYRINERLLQMNGVTADSMRLLQNDNKNVVAQSVLPAMIALLEGMQTGETENTILSLLKTWDYRAEAGSPEQSVFNTWWQNLKQSLWNDEFTEVGLFPSTEVSILTVAQNRNTKWVDDLATTETETLAIQVRNAWKKTMDSLQARYGTDLSEWSWGDVKQTRISHLARIDAFSRYDLKTGGNSGIVNATRDDHGPSWRMIVELGEHPRAYGIFPGGQSGNPGSPFYDNMIERWARGEQMELLYLSSDSVAADRILSTLTLCK